MTEQLYSALGVLLSMIEKNIHLLNGYIERAITESPLRIKER